MKDNIISIKNVKFSYGENAPAAVDGVSLDIAEGETVCILGHNGSGKSTLGKLMNALLAPDEGEVWVMGKSTTGEDIWEIRRSVGMVFQNPDDQLVASLTDEDIAFGLENIGLPPEEMDERIDFALDSVGMTEFRHSPIDRLSLGQKQKIAVAGILALRPKCIVLDEATAMLDPKGRRDVCNTVFRLNSIYGITVVMITHFIDEAALCDKIYIMEQGRIVMGGKRQEVLPDTAGLKAFGISPPFFTDIAVRLGFDGGLYSAEEVAGKIADRICRPYTESGNTAPEDKRENIIEIRDLYFAYDKEPVLKGINIDVKEGSFTSVIGHTGSGKSTLMRTLNGLYSPIGGNVYFRGKSISDYEDIKRRIALVFQNPDHQLFEETVIKDVMFGALNMGLSHDKARELAEEALVAVGFPKDKYESSPFELSGGEKKRAAIAGILVMQPEVLVLDEPGAGLDTGGRRDIADCIERLKKERNLTVISVTHSMEDAAEYSDNIVVLCGGRVLKQAAPMEIFRQSEELEKAGLDLPKTAKLRSCLEKKGIRLPDNILSADALVDCLRKRMS